MQSVGVVGGDHEAARNASQIVLLAVSLNGEYAAQCVHEQRGCRALLGAAAGLLIVEYGGHANVGAFFGSIDKR